jgi:hypothetical protein
MKNDLSGIRLSEIIAEYARCRSFEKIARAHDLHRPDIRRAMSRAARFLLGGDPAHKEIDVNQTTPEQLAMGAYIFNLIDKSNPTEQGKSERQKAKTARCVVRVDPPCVGEFRVAVNDPDWDSLFVSRANR